MTTEKVVLDTNQNNCTWIWSKVQKELVKDHLQMKINLVSLKIKIKIEKGYRSFK